MKYADAAGVTLIKRIRVRVFNVENDGHTTRIFKARPGEGLTESGIDELLEAVSEDLDKRFPDDEFSLVEIAADSYNFVWRRKRGSC